MRNKADDDAFPTPSDYSERGMTKREYLAVQALVGIGTWVPDLSHRASADEILKRKAQWAVAQADALIEELSK